MIRSYGKFALFFTAYDLRRWNGGHLLNQMSTFQCTIAIFVDSTFTRRKHLRLGVSREQPPCANISRFLPKILRELLLDRQMVHEVANGSWLVVVWQVDSGTSWLKTVGKTTTNGQLFMMMMLMMMMMMIIIIIIRRSGSWIDEPIMVGP